MTRVVTNSGSSRSTTNAFVVLRLLPRKNAFPHPWFLQSFFFPLVKDQLWIEWCFSARHQPASSPVPVPWLEEVWNRHFTNKLQ
jgi:hypothetical protein